MFSELIPSLKQGIHVNGCVIHAYRILRGRFLEEQNIELHYRIKQNEDHLLNAKVFAGRPPDYSPWVELFDIREPLTIDANKKSYFDSLFEDRVLSLFAEALDPGSSLFVEYYSDNETQRQLQMGVPVALSRLGNKMLRLGFTWFKDWYFPEGYLEGNQKLQGEKPLDARARERHFNAIRQEVLHFAEQSGRDNTDEQIRKALSRVRDTLAIL
jgi:hypothetical protein